MKKLYCSFFLALLSTSAFPQIETHYYLNSAENMISLFLLNEYIPTYNIDCFDPQTTSNEEINSPNKFAKGYDVSISLDNGIWNTVDEGRIWSIAIQSVNASSLTVSFNDLQLSENSYMYIENEDKTVLYGPVSKENIPNKGRFLTDVIPGNIIRIIIFEPTSSFDRTTMRIDKVYCGYKKIDNQMGTRECENDIACDNNYQMESFGIAHIVYSLYSYLFRSTGFLVMTTDLSFKPYLQTAYHTLDINGDSYISDAEKAAVQNGTFIFNYKHTTCGGNIIASTCTYNGATVRAYHSPTDFALLELGNIVSNNSTLTWLGWDKGSSVPTSGVGLHHPLGNPMKISYENDSFSTIDYENSGVYNHWLVNFDNGVVKHGSSGSPILNQNKKVVGQLHGNDQYNSSQDYCLQPRAQYGKFNLSWTGGGTNSTRLSNWLDPAGTNQTTINSCHPMGDIVGDSFICSYKEYCIDGLPSGYTVSWSLSDSCYNNGYNLLIQDYPTTGHCLIVRDQNHDLKNDTLKAEIKYNNIIVQTLRKPGINAYDDFWGQYTSGNLNGEIDYSHYFNMKPNTTTTVTSPNFHGATVTYDSSGATPTAWGFNPTNGVLNFKASAGSTVVINVVDGCQNQYTLYAHALSSYLMNTSNGDDCITITLNEDGESSMSSDFDQHWTVEIRNAVTGELMATQSSTSRSTTISTAGWPKGMYVVRVTVGKEVLTEKVIVK